MEEERLYDLYALDEDIKILENLVVTLENHHLGGGKEILHLIEAYREVKEQNRDLKDMVDFRVKYCNELEEKLIKADKNYIPKSKIKEKIEEILEKGKQMSDKERQEETQFMQGKLKALEELLEEE